MLININSFVHIAKKLGIKMTDRLTELPAAVFTAEFKTAAAGEGKLPLKSGEKNLIIQFKQHSNGVNAAAQAVSVGEKNSKGEERSIYADVRAGPLKGNYFEGGDAVGSC